jgi:hypothetical protein
MELDKFFIDRYAHPFSYASIIGNTPSGVIVVRWYCSLSFNTRRR